MERKEPHIQLDFSDISYTIGENEMKNTNVITSDHFGDEKEIPEYIQKLRERMTEMKKSIEQITSNTESICVTTLQPSKEKMMILTELYNEVHHMCGEVRQIISHLRTFKNIEMRDYNIEMVKEAEEEINDVLKLLAKLKVDLHEKISEYIQSVERKELILNQQMNEEFSSKSIDTELSFVTETMSSKVSNDNHQIKFISDYIKTLVKNIDEIYNSLSSLKTDEIEDEKLMEKINDLKILERHLKRNEPLIKEVEFWLSHDFSKPERNQEESIMKSLKTEYNELCDVMSRTNSLLSYKNELLHKEVELRKMNDLLKPERKKFCKRKAKTSCSSDCKEDIFSDEELKLYYSKQKVKQKKLLKDIEEAKSVLAKLFSILENINQAIEDNRFVSITNDSVVAQQGYIFKIQIDLLKMHQKDLDWLISFTQPEKLCKTEVPDDLLLKITDLKVKWNLTKDRIIHAQETLSKIRELWILFEYYTVRVMLWIKAINIKDPKKDTDLIKQEAEIIKRKISRVKKIKKKFSYYISDFSKKIIEKLWLDTENEFNTVYNLL